MSLESLATLADAVGHIEFYLFQSTDGTKQEIQCRLWARPGMSKEDQQKLVCELNKAIKPITERWEREILLQAEDAVKALLRQNGIPR